MKMITDIALILLPLVPLWWAFGVGAKGADDALHKATWWRYAVRVLAACALFFVPIIALNYHPLKFAVEHTAGIPKDVFGISMIALCTIPLGYVVGSLKGAVWAWKEAQEARASAADKSNKADFGAVYQFEWITKTPAKMPNRYKSQKWLTVLSMRAGQIPALVTFEAGQDGSRKLVEIEKGDRLEVVDGEWDKGAWRHLDSWVYDLTPAFAACPVIVLHKQNGAIHKVAEYHDGNKKIEFANHVATMRRLLDDVAASPAPVATVAAPAGFEF